MHDSLVELHDVGRHLGDLRRDLDYPVIELLDGKRAVRPAELDGLDPRDRVSRDHHLHGLAHADEPRVEMHVGHAEAHRRVAHLRVLGDVHQVAAGGELAAARQAVAVHLRDHRLGQVPDAHPTLGDVTRPRPFSPGRVEGHLLTLVAAGQVVPGGERRAGAAHDLHAHRAVLIPLAQRLQ